MRCELCNKATRCSCRGGGCPGCNSDNKTVSFTNDLIKFGLEKSLVKEKLKWIRGYVGKIDTFTMYEFLSGEISEEEFNKAVEDYKQSGSSMVKSVAVKQDNPTKSCYYEFPGTWARCKYCNGIYKFMKGKECPAYKEKKEEETPVTTEA